MYYTWPKWCPETVERDSNQCGGFNTDPAPTFYFNADPDPKFERIKFFFFKRRGEV